MHCSCCRCCSFAYASKPDYLMLHCCSPLAGCDARRKKGQPGLSGEGGGFEGLGGDPVNKPRLYTRQDRRIESKPVMELNKAVGAATE